MATHKQPPGWAIQEAQDELDSEETTEAQIMKRASEIAEAEQARESSDE